MTTYMIPTKKALEKECWDEHFIVLYDNNKWEVYG